MTLIRRLPSPALLLLLLAGLGLAAAMVRAQIEGGERGVAPIDSTSNYEIGGVAVDVSAKTAEQARVGGWRLAQRKGWKMLYARVNGVPVNQAPGLPDSTLDSIVGGIIVESEQIGPTRYIARLGVLFDRARAGQLLGVKGQVLRSPPMLVIPVMWSGGTPQTFETRTEWQKAWARFRSGGSPIDYVRPSGTGSDPLLLNVAQANRRGRTWWRLLLDSYGAADIVTPQVFLDRLWPGGPVVGRFTALHGPDGKFIGGFTLRAANGDGLPDMMDEGVRRIDELYSAALRDGRLQPDPSLVIEEPAEAEELLPSDEALADSMLPGVATYVVQVETPDAGTLGAIEASLRAVPGMRSVATTSLALGDVSVMRLMFDGDIGALRIALGPRGWRADESSGTIRLRRQAPTPPPAAPPVAPPGPAPSPSPPPPAR